MAKFTAKVVEFTPSFIMKAKSGKNMEMWKLEYEVGGNAKSFQGFASQLKTDRVLAKQLSQFSPGDYVEIETEKNAAGYDNIKTLAPAGTKQMETGSSSTNNSRPQSSASRDFETKEERTARQRLIVRQSSLAQAIAVTGSGTSKVKDILALAEKFTDWVFEEESEPAFDAGKKEPAARGSSAQGTDLKDDDLDDDVPL